LWSASARGDREARRAGGEGRRAAVNVAIVKLSSLGDIVHALPVAAALRQTLPHGHLTWVVEHHEAALLRGNPAIDEVAVADTRGWRRLSGRGAHAVRAVGTLLRQFRHRGFDVAVDLQGNLKSGVLTAATGAALRIGFTARRCREPINALFTNRRIEPPLTARHVVDQHLALLGPLGVEPGKATFWLPRDAAADAAMGRALGGYGLSPATGLVVLHPGAGRAAKRWASGRFTELARRLRAATGTAVLVLWGPAERSHAEAIARESGALLAPPTDLPALLALLRRTRVMVAADTGPLHLAAALDVACVGLYGPTDPARTGPYGSGHRVVCGDRGAMASLPVEPVLAAVAELLN
jgi:lipopolysaccharide heptosyltransferase I